MQAQQRWQAGAHHGIGTGNLGGTRSRSGAEQGLEPAWDRDDREAHGGGGDRGRRHCVPSWTGNNHLRAVQAALTFELDQPRQDFLLQVYFFQMERMYWKGNVLLD